MLKLIKAAAAGMMLFVVLHSQATAAEGFKKRVLVFGDSNTYGAIPANAAPFQRYPDGIRWPDVLQAALGDEFEVIAEGLSARTTDQPDSSFIPGAGFDGAQYLPAAIASNLPLDVVVILLGTNDLKPAYNRSAFRIALGAGILVDIAKNANLNVGTEYSQPKVLLITPPALSGAVDTSPFFKEMYAGSLAKSKDLPPLYEAISEMAGVANLDANTVITSDGVDGIHFSEKGHAALGKAVADKLKSMF